MSARAVAALGESWVGLLFGFEFHPPLDRRLSALRAMTRELEAG